MQYLRARRTPDGLLLDLIANSFVVLITRDSNMRHQQNFQRHPRFSMISITTGDGSIEDLLLLVPAIQNALRKIKPGQDIYLLKELVENALRNRLPYGCGSAGG